MSDSKICQSCSMPLDGVDLWGTEKDGSKNHEYCKFCYKDGAFTNPGITLDQMKAHMRKIMGKEKLPEDIMEAAISRLPHLKRWIGESEAVVK